MSYTRKQYLDKECSHREYYAQFVTPGVVDRIVRRLGADRLLASQDEHLNDIPLHIWDDIPAPMGSGQAMRALGDYPTLAGAVCINKEAARQFIAKEGA